MSVRRTARVASVVREVVSTSILLELRDPRIQNVTVLGAEVSPDLRYASVRISVMGDDRTAALTMHGLNSARGYLQSKIAERIRSRYTPELRFVLDTGVKKSVETSRILRDILNESAENGEPETPEEFDEDEDTTGFPSGRESRPVSVPEAGTSGSEAETSSEVTLRDSERDV